VHAGLADRASLVRHLASFQRDVAALERAGRDQNLDVDLECEVAEREEIELKTGVRP